MHPAHGDAMDPDDARRRHPTRRPRGLRGLIGVGLAGGLLRVAGQPLGRVSARPRRPGPSVRTAVHGDRLAVHLVGPLDVSTVGALHEVLRSSLAAGSCDLVVVLTDVTFLDATGLGVLVSAHTRARACGGRLGLVVDRESIVRVFRLTGLSRVLRLHRTLDDALAA